MNCPRCGRENPDSAPQCATCGAVLMPPTLNPRTSGLAIASLVSSLTCVGGLLGIILGIIALRQISRRREELGGSGLAIAGIVVGVVMGLLILPGMLSAMLFPVFARARESANKAQCMVNVKNIALALAMYASDYGAYPQALTWADKLAPDVRERRTFICPDAPGKRSGYAYAAPLSGKAPEELQAPDAEVAIFEADLGWNGSGVPAQSLADPPRHMGGDVWGFADGHAKWYDRDDPGGPAAR